MKTMKEKRNKTGIKAGVFGLGVNTFLALAKMAIGVLSQSQTLIADGLNNLSDGLNALIAILGFTMAAKPADKQHPYGHRRFEMIGGLIMTLVMLLLAYQILSSAVRSFLNPTVLVFSIWLFAMLLVSIVFKLGLRFYYLRLNRTMDSDVLLALAQDSRNDALISAALMFGLGAKFLFGFAWMDAVLSILIAALMIFDAYHLLRRFVNDLLGMRPDQKQVDDIIAIIEQQEGILGYHDLLIHSYGEGKNYATVHLELPAELTLLEAHDRIDQIERDVKKKMGIDLLVHIDPVEDNKRIQHYQKIVTEVLADLCDDLSYHDLRFIHQRLMFDVVTGETCPYDDEALKKHINAGLKRAGLDVATQIQIDRNVLV